MRNPNVKECYVNLNGSNFWDVRTFVKVLRNHPGIRTMWIFGYHVEDERIELIGNALKTTNISTVNLYNFTDSSLTQIAEIIPHIPIRSLFIQGGTVSHVGMKALAQKLINSTLEELHIVLTSISDEGVRAIVPILRYTSIKVLRLVWNKITDAGIDPFLSELSNTKIHTLRILEDRRMHSFFMKLRELKAKNPDVVIYASTIASEKEITLK